MDLGGRKRGVRVFPIRAVSHRRVRSGEIGNRAVRERHSRQADGGAGCHDGHVLRRGAVRLSRARPNRGQPANRPSRHSARLLIVLRGLLRGRRFQRIRHGLVRRGADFSRDDGVRPRGALSPAARQDLRGAAFGVACVRAALAVHSAGIRRRDDCPDAFGGGVRRRNTGGVADAGPQPIRHSRRRLDCVRRGVAGVQPRQRIRRHGRGAVAVGLENAAIGNPPGRFGRRPSI